MISFKIYTARRRRREKLNTKVISICYAVLLIVEMWGRRADVLEEQQKGNRRLEYAEFRRWLDEEEEYKFFDMLAEFDGIEDDTEEDWFGWLSFREEFEVLLYFYVEEVADLEDWDAEMVIGRYFDGV